MERALSFSSYPSGHVLNLTSFFGTLLILSWLAMQPTWYRLILQVMSAVLVVCIGVARIYSGEHWPSDIVAGYLQASVVVALTVLLYISLGQRPRRGVRKPERLLVAPPVSGACLVTLGAGGGWFYRRCRQW